MAKKPSKSQQVESEDISQEETEVELAAETPTDASGVSKAEVCRAALAQGIETTEAAVSFAMREFGIEIKPTDFSLYKSKAKKKAELSSKKTGNAKPGRKKAATEDHIAPPSKKNGDSDLLDALSSMKPLIAQFGAAKVKQMADLLG